jgi:hypothetical protein
MMFGTSSRTALRRSVVLAVLAAVLLSLPAGAADVPSPKNRAYANFSQAVAFHQWLSHPDAAPAQLSQALATLTKLRGKGAARSGKAAQAFNFDVLGLPQNEESIAACRAKTNIVLGGTNDYRGILDPEGNFTGWHLSLDGGTTLANEGLLPSIDGIPSGGDPVDAVDADCNLYASSLNYDPFDPFHNLNGIGMYRTTAATLAACPSGSDPSCWPTRRLVATSAPSHFLDKEWFDVGESGPAGRVVWVVFSDFVIDDSAPLGYTSASIMAVRCDAALAACTAPILISGTDLDVQFADVTIGPDGRVYVTWSEIQNELPGENGQPGQPQTFIHKLRIAPAGSTTFGPTRVIAVEEKPIAFGAHLHSADFRVATYPKHAVVGGSSAQRIFVTWDACSALATPFDFVCEEPVIKLTYSDDDGATWSTQTVISKGGDNYFPTIASDPLRGTLALAWFTSRYDPVFHNRQDVELVSVDATRVRVGNPSRITKLSNEPEADPLLGGFFIGDYIEVFAHDKKVWVHFNANYRSVRLLGEFAEDGVPIPQQDNFLTTAHD